MIRTTALFPVARPTRPPVLAVAAAVSVGLVVLLAGCAGSSSGTAPGTGSSVSVAASVTSPAGTAVVGLSLKDGWVKSAPGGMTAIFGTLDNPTGQDITVLSGASPVAGMVELHEVVTVNGAAKMRPKTGGFMIPAHGGHVLRPGGDHIMIMGLRRAVKAGDTVTAILTLKDGATVEVSAIGKDYAGGNETYAPSGAGMSMGSGGSMSGSPAR